MSWTREHAEAMERQVDDLRRALWAAMDERDDYKERWETLGRVAKKMIDRLEQRIALYREYGSPDLTALVEGEAKRLSSGTGGPLSRDDRPPED